LDDDDDFDDYEEKMTLNTFFGCFVQKKTQQHAFSLSLALLFVFSTRRLRLRRLNRRLRYHLKGGKF